MKKEKFIKMTFILMLGGLVTKLLGMFIRIIMARIVSDEGISLYMLIFPTFSLFMTISQMSFPTAISKLVSEDKYNNKRIVFSIIPVSLILNIVLMLIILLMAPFIANNLLNDSRCYYPILCIALVLPFDSISSILRGYFFGKQKMIPHVLSNILEQVIRLILIVLIVPKLLDYSLIHAVSMLILVNVFSELLSIIVLFFFLPRNFIIKKEDIVPNRLDIKNVLSISIPTTTSRIIGSIGYFLEPIILTSNLLYVGYSNSYIVGEYGIISAYVLPLLLFPSFFTLAISSALLPVVSKAYAEGKYSYIKSKIKVAILFSLLIGVPATLVFIFIPWLPLKLIYNTSKGIKYIKVLAPFCLLQYIESPIASCIDAMGRSKDNMKITLYGMLIRCFVLFVCSFLKIGIWCLIISIVSNIIFQTLYGIKCLKGILAKK